MIKRVAFLTSLLLAFAASVFAAEKFEKSLTAYPISATGGTVVFVTPSGRSETGTIVYPSNDDVNTASTDGFGSGLVQGTGGLTPPLGTAVFVVSLTIYSLPPQTSPVMATVHFTGNFKVKISAGTPINTSNTYVIYALDRNDANGLSTWNGPFSPQTVTATGMTFEAPFQSKPPGHFCAFVVSQLGTGTSPPPVRSAASVVGEDLGKTTLAQD